ncbi:putative photosystem I [Medicago truncatula]|uniref:Putative photosystem I n=1 Tax=Medicago truncatula TaxID=3880 RepID=A0A396I4D5_MEDTR|nr:putative photosystem I [Medicago truncatula]
MYSLPAYAFIAQDFTTQAALYTHHQYIAGFIMTGAFAHGAIFLFGITIPNRMRIMYWQEC